MISLGSQIKVFLAVGMVDMRNSIDGLSLLVKDKVFTGYYQKLVINK